MARIHEQVVETLARFSRPGDSLFQADDPVTIHAERLMLRGLEERAAWMQARGMVGDAEHRKWCEICNAGKEVSDGGQA
jgi:hypothetical protein